MCQHQPPCPPADATDRQAAHVLIAHPEQGWSLLCNGIVLFEDTGVLLPGGQSIPPHQPAVGKVPAAQARAVVAGDSTAAAGRPGAARRRSASSSRKGPGRLLRRGHPADCRAGLIGKYVPGTDNSGPLGNYDQQSRLAVARLATRPILPE
jgi:hypothetical protein